MSKVFFILICTAVLSLSHGFSPNNAGVLKNSLRTADIKIVPSKLYASDLEKETTDEVSSASEVTKKSLEDKMKEWEASDEEIKNASLGGITPGRSDGFDIGLLLAFPFIVGSALFFAIFPLIMDKIDVSSVGPPPTV
mmetsp:Transcript_2335/g.2826  ORF Transcript_2335/g.2826 Transcript_2335/m.2826 type:complete len:138 (-) Transcript_2335:132-545(-)|eukprot:CAMPEP_0203669188 /NCGR_PEP_ID=MMETSP0090-20130426/5625_1 /ASSEMBLY_ACC=CAM_ASM_001088 /TAXON_ID=426623 /ORGANISM="Chaetoceros affinis, Strain CCMP159" /LENGTH=137 /DNA_ID=CAMNT_0050533807 /DNA_START=48 /DNA_END=461 /DNA_ORIENTATION=-